MIQLNRIQLTSQTTNHVEITNILNTSQRESLFNKCEKIRSFIRICSHLLKKFIFYTLICKSKLIGNYSQEENNLFFEKL